MDEGITVEVSGIGVKASKGVLEELSSSEVDEGKGTTVELSGGVVKVAKDVAVESLNAGVLPSPLPDSPVAMSSSPLPLVSILLSPTGKCQSRKRTYKKY